MVVVRRIRAVNFRRLDLKESLELGRGVVFVKGRNEAGKSTLIEAILFGVYGDYRIVGSLRGNPQAGYSDVINHHARRAVVEVEFEIDGKTYRVERSLERTRGSISQSMARLIEITENGERLVASTVSGVNEQIAKLLRVSWREMLTTNVVAQKDLERIIRMKGDDRERVVNLMMGLEAYNRATDKIEEERRALQVRAETFKARLEEVERAIAILEEQKRNVSSWREKLASLEREFPNFLKHEGFSRRAVEYLEGLSTILKQKDDLEKDLSIVEKRLVDLQEQFNDALKEKSRVEADIQSLRARSSEYFGVKERVLQLESEMNRIGEAVKSLKTPLWAKAGASILIAGGLVLTLLTPLSLLLTAMGVFLGIGGVVVKARRRGDFYKKRSRVEGELAGLKLGFEALKKSEDDFKRLNEEAQMLSSRIEKLGKQRDELKSHAAEAIERLSTISLPSFPEELVEHFTGLDLNSHEVVENARQNYAEKYRKAYENRVGAEASIKELRGRIMEAEKQVAQLDALKKESERISGELGSITFEVEARKRSVELMQEVSRMMRESFAPSVEEYMSWAISHFTGGRYKAVRLDPGTYDVEIYDTEAGSWLRRDIYSGGTNDQFLLALRIAFTLSLLPSAKGVYPRFLVLDEPLGSSDADRRNRIIGFLAGELTRFFDQLLIITHVDVEEPPGSRVIVLDDGRVSGFHIVGGNEDSGFE
ncbi:MAG: AAA family ATPase [Thermoproteota archaeon]